MSTLLIAFLVGCGGKPPAKSPAGEPGPGQPETTEPTVGGSEPSAVETSAPTDSAASSAAPAPAAEKPCKKLKKGLCKVTRGCAWRDGPSAGCIEATEASESSGATDE